MANEKHLNILKQGVEAWNTWREENPEIKVDLSGANLREANLYEADLIGADLSHADLSRADLSRADLLGANLEGVNLLGANLEGVDLSVANLSGADIYGADLNYANLSGAYLSHADLSYVDLSGAYLSHADLSGAYLYEANLSAASLVETNFTNANLTGCSIYGISAWNVKLEGAKQTKLVITRENEPTIKVDDLEVAQFIYLLLNHKKLRNVLDAVTHKGVLILGRFGDGGLDVLEAIAQKLRELEYLPIIFDFDRPESRDYTATIKTLAGLSRFVIADLSGPSVPLELYATAPHFEVPVVPIIETARKQFALAVDFRKYPWFLSPTVEFENKEQLLNLLPESVIAPAEQKHREIQQSLNERYNPD